MFTPLTLRWSTWRRAIVSMLVLLAAMGLWSCRDAATTPNTSPPAKKTSADGVHLAQGSQRARIETVNRVRILHLYGSSGDMGVQQGTLMRKEIHQLYKGYLLKFVGGKINAQRAAHIARTRMLPHIPPNYVEEMKGLAEGSGLTFDQVLAAQAFLDLKKVVQCSTVAVSGKAAAGEEPMLGRNLDFPSLGIAEKHSMVIVRHPSRGLATVTVGWPLLLGTLSGINERGVAAAMMEVETDSSGLDGMPYALLYRQALEQARNNHQVINHLKKARRTASNNLMVMDAHGHATVIEITAKEIAIRTSQTGTLFATNHHVTPSTDKPTTCWRYAKLQAMLKARTEPVDVQALQTILKAVDIERMNLQAMIFFPRKRSLRLSIGRIPAVNGPYVDLSRQQLFGPSH